MKKDEKERRSKGAGTLFTRGKKKKYYLKYTVNGKHKTICLETTLRKEAEQKAKEFRPIIESRTKEEIAAHVAIARKIAKPKTSLPLSGVWDAYLKSPLRSDPVTLLSGDFLGNRCCLPAVASFPSVSPAGCL
jgi:hypothetical protein